MQIAWKFFKTLPSQVFAALRFVSGFSEETENNSRSALQPGTPSVKGITNRTQMQVYENTFRFLVAFSTSDPTPSSGTHHQSPPPPPITPPPPPWTPPDPHHDHHYVIIPIMKNQPLPSQLTFGLSPASGQALARACRGASWPRRASDAAPRLLRSAASKGGSHVRIDHHPPARIGSDGTRE